MENKYEAISPTTYGGYPLRVNTEKRRDAVTRYRKLPVEIEAIQWKGDNTEEIKMFCGESFLEYKPPSSLLIGTLEGPHIASLGDYIIKGIKGEFYPCKPDIFKSTYDPV